MAEAKGIKELKELLEGLALLGVAGKKIMADGKVNLADLPVVIGLVQDASVLTAAVQGTNEIPAEVKDLSAEEAQELLGLVLAIAARVKAA
ncbi:MAG: hypothetical protein KF767_08850 [Bdellovibrionaceae bacterium]|nr:hypothetical protein [Pseudobdellovibrionaceae bacterium]